MIGEYDLIIEKGRHELTVSAYVDSDDKTEIRIIGYYDESILITRADAQAIVDHLTAVFKLGE